MKKIFIIKYIMIAVMGIGFVSKAYASANMPEINFNCGDRTFFHSDYTCDNNTDTYPGVISSPKEGNTITYHRFDYRYDYDADDAEACKQHLRDNNYIVLNKASANDCHFDVYPTRSEYSNGQGKYTDYSYTYYLVNGEVMVDRLGPVYHLCYLRGVDNENSVYSMRINKNGQVVTNDNNIIYNVTPGEWYKYAVAVDLEANVSYLYIAPKDDEEEAMVCRGTSVINDNFVLDRFRFWINSEATGIMSLNSLEITGTQNLYNGTDNGWDSVLSEDSGIEEYLSDKTAIHAYSGSVFANGKKTYPNTAFEYNNNEAYTYLEGIRSVFCLDEEDIEILENGTVYLSGEAFMLSVKPYTEDDKLFVPIKAFAQDVLGLYSFDDGEGLIIFDNEEIGLSAADEIPVYKTEFRGQGGISVIRSINWYMAFERPTAEEIQLQFESQDVAHPRILATKEEFDYIRDNRDSDSYLKKICDKVIAKADVILEKDVLEYTIPDKQRLLSISREMLDRMQKLGFAYQITKDKKYADCAFENMKKCAAYMDWNPSHMIDVGEMNAAFAIGYDWCYDAFNDTQKDIIFNGIRKNGLTVTQKAYYGRLPSWPQWAQASGAFVLWKGNFNTVINGGAIAAALSFFEHDRELCSDILEKGIRSIEYTLPGYSPDGGWVEGETYWTYSMQYLSIGVGSLLTALNSDYGLMDSNGMSEAGLWYISMTSPQGTNNFHDSRSEAKPEYNYHPWLAKVYDDEGLHFVRKELAEQKNSYTVFDAIWYMPDAVETKDSLPLAFMAKGIESVTVRSSYEDDGMYFSAIGGSVFCNHSHADAGSFIYDVNGVRWASDLGMVPYDLVRDAGQGIYAPYRRRAEAHNVVVINPNTSEKDGGQDDDGFAEIVRHEDGAREVLTVYDMSSVYPDYTSEYTRSFTADKTDGSLVICDDIVLTSDENSINWFMTVPVTLDSGNIKWHDDGYFTIENNGQVLYGKFKAEGAEFKGETLSCTPILGAPVIEGQSTEPNYSRLRIYAENVSSGRVKLMVMLSPDRVKISGLFNEDEAEFVKIPGEHTLKAEIEVFADTTGNRENEAQYMVVVYNDTALDRVYFIAPSKYFDISVGTNSEVKVLAWTPESVKPLTLSYTY